MKTIKIFLASSEELDNDRMAFGNLVRRLDDMYEKRGIRIKLFEWEDYDAAYNNRRKQDEYNDHVRQCNIFLALFHKKAGKFTMEEFDIASEEFRKHASPKVYTYCKDLKDGEEESAELKEFKQQLFNEMGHYWCRYDNRESLQLQFVMQLQLVESSQMEGLKVENGEVTLDGLRVASMDKLQFAAANEDYLRMQTDLNELHDEIEAMQLKLEKKEAKLEKKKAKLEEDPDDEDYQEEYQELKEEVDELTDRLQPKLNKYNKLKEDFAEHQQLLFNTAKRVAQLQGERITERMRRAMDALTEGKVREANIILDEAEADARRNLEDYLQSKEITELKRQNVITSIDELLLKATSVMSDASIPIEERIEKAEKIYQQADEMAQKCAYDKSSYAQLLLKYGDFLYTYGKYSKALKVYEHECSLQTELNVDDNNLYIATSYNNLGNVHRRLKENELALEYYMKAVIIREQILGAEHSITAQSYNNLGIVYHDLHDYKQALDYHKRALRIKETVLGVEHPSTAISYNNIGSVYSSLKDYDHALEYYGTAGKIWEKVLGREHPNTATSYNNIGSIYDKLGDYDHATKHHLMALTIREKALGLEHPDTAQSYNNLGNAYDSLEDYDRALECYQKAVEIREKVLGKEHTSTASSYYDLGSVYDSLGDYSHAIEYYRKAVDIREKKLGDNHSATVSVYNDLAWALQTMGEYDEALLWAEKAFSGSPDDTEIIDTLATVYQGLDRDEEALEKYELCLKLQKEQHESEESIHETEEKIEELKKQMKQ